MAGARYRTPNRQTIAIVRNDMKCINEYEIRGYDRMKA